MNSVTSKSFNVMAFPNESIGDIKHRIQQIEGVPITRQLLTRDGAELPDSTLVSKFADREQIFLSIKKTDKEHTVTL